MAPAAGTGLLITLLKLALSLALIGWILSGIDRQAALALVAAVDPLDFGLGLVAIAAAAAMSGLRWLVVVRALGGWIGIADSLRLSFVGLFFNQFLPSNVGGDAFRAIGLYRVGASPRLAVVSTLLDRVAGLLGIVFFIVVFLPLTPELRAGMGWWVSPVLAAALLAGSALLAILERLPAAWSGWKAVRTVVEFGADARRVFLRPACSLTVLGGSLLCQLLTTLSFVAFAAGLGLPVAPFPFLALVPVVMLASALPVSIAGWGMRETVVVFGFGLVGIAREPALIMALSFGLGNLLVGLPGGWLWMSLLRRRPSRDTAP